jgi:hypothetical protein
MRSSLFLDTNIRTVFISLLHSCRIYVGCLYPDTKRNQSDSCRGGKTQLRNWSAESEERLVSNFSEVRNKKDIPPKMLFNVKR